ncbi:hypothetical protein CRE_27835 [Caenorhabditis remanei]|uniref:Uncharacterized protein n=1 Tax=Caenorhabditis remanei TaxID=31234 RepID=E3NA81_CAERE|nr:hypothetical protein CRE_27835 [Caenorhabditis remanei]
MFLNGTPKSSLKTAPYRIPLNRRGMTNASSIENLSPSNSMSHHQSVNQSMKIRESKYDTGSSSSTSGMSNPQLGTLLATVDGRWSPYGFAATQLYDNIQGVPLDRETCEANLQKLVRNIREIDYYEFLTSAQQYREQGKPLLEKTSLQLAFMDALSNKQYGKASNHPKQEVRLFSRHNVHPDFQKQSNLGGYHLFSLDKACAKFDGIVELPNRKYFQLSKAFRLEAVAEWCGSDQRKSLRNFGRYLFDEIGKRDNQMICYSASQNAGMYLPVSDAFFKTITDFAVEGFGKEHTSDVSALFLLTLKDVLANKLNRLRKSYNHQYGKGGSESAVMWLKEELAKPNGALIRSEIVFSPTNDGSNYVYDEVDQEDTIPEDDEDYENREEQVIVDY